MMASNFDDENSLKKEWYKKLKDAGFEDCENTAHSHNPLKKWHSFKWAKVSKEKLELTEAYYQRARELLETYHFSESIHKTIWEFHSEGLSKRKIAEKIKHIDGAPKREWIGMIIATIAGQIK